MQFYKWLHTMCIIILPCSFSMYSVEHLTMFLLYTYPIYLVPFNYTIATAKTAYLLYNANRCSEQPLRLNFVIVWSMQFMEKFFFTHIIKVTVFMYTSYHNLLHMLSHTQLLRYKSLKKLVTITF